MGFRLFFKEQFKQTKNKLNRSPSIFIKSENFNHQDFSYNTYTPFQCGESFWDPKLLKHLQGQPLWSKFHRKLQQRFPTSAENKGDNLKQSAGDQLTKNLFCWSLLCITQLSPCPNFTATAKSLLQTTVLKSSCLNSSKCRHTSHLENWSWVTGIFTPF